MTRQRFLAKQQCVENVIVVDTLDVTRNRAVSLDCACSAEIVYYNTRNNNNKFKIRFTRTTQKAGTMCKRAKAEY